MFSDHNLLRTLALSRPYVSLEKKGQLHIFFQTNLRNNRESEKSRMALPWTWREKKKEKKFLSIHDDHLRITFSISMNRQPSEWLAGSKDLRSSLIRASVIPGEVRSAVSNALRSSSIAPPFLPMPLPPSPLLSLAEYWCFLWSYAQEQRN